MFVRDLLLWLGLRCPQRRGNLRCGGPNICGKVGHAVFADAARWARNRNACDDLAERVDDWCRDAPHAQVFLLIIHGIAARPNGGDVLTQRIRVRPGKFGEVFKA